jgi:hypothetical protein
VAPVRLRLRLRRLGYGAAAAVVAGVLVAGVVDDVQVQVQLHHSHDRAAATRLLLRRTDALLSSTTASLARAEAGGDVTSRSLTQVTAELTSARALLGQTRRGVASGDIEVGAVHSCASGVDRSATALEDGNQSGAVAELSAVAPVCENILGTEPGGPVYPFDFADPDVLVVRGTYYAYGTNSTAGNIQIMKSTDLQSWTKAGDALPTLASWAAPGDTWAPAVISLKRTYVLYYTAALAGTKTQCISVATARRPQGPFVDTSSAPLECQPGLGGSIDPSPILDAAGHPYLVWKSNGDGAQPATIWAEPLDPQGTALEGAGPTEILRPSQAWEGSVVEAPSMIQVDGSYWLFYSGNNWDSSQYAIGVARCAGVLGPCAQAAAVPLLGSQPNFEGPGGESVFTDSQGNLEMAFQAWLPGAVGYPHMRLLFVRPLTLAAGIPRLQSPG